MSLADAWYTSGTFWGATGAIAVLITCAVATWVAFMLANPVRRLQCGMLASPLLPASAQAIPGSLEITWNGQELQEPNVLDVSLTNHGRRDIWKEDFDQPLEFRVKATILAVLATTTRPDSTPFSAVDFKDDVLKVGPGLIRRHQTVKFTLLAIGAAPALSSSATALREVDVEVLTADQSHRNNATRFKTAAGLAAGAAVAGLVLVGLLIGHEFLPRTSQPSAGVPTTASATASVAASPSETPLPPQVTKSLQNGETDLKSTSTTAQLSGIGLLQSAMRTGSEDQPTVLRTLANFIRDHSPAGNNDQPITHVIQTALQVLLNRKPANDDGTVIDLSNVNLTSAGLSGINLKKASLVNTDLDDAVLSDASLQGANLNYAFLGGADLVGANLSGANLVGASLYSTPLCKGSTPTDPQQGYNCNANG